MEERFSNLFGFSWLQEVKRSVSIGYSSRFRYCIGSFVEFKMIIGRDHGNVIKWAKEKEVYPIKWAKGNVEYPSNLASIKREIAKLVSLMTVTFLHVYKEANEEA